MKHWTIIFSTRYHRDSSGCTWLGHEKRAKTWFCSRLESSWQWMERSRIRIELLLELRIWKTIRNTEVFGGFILQHIFDSNWKNPFVQTEWLRASNDITFFRETAYNKLCFVAKLLQLWVLSVITEFPLHMPKQSDDNNESDYKCLNSGECTVDCEETIESILEDVAL